MNVSTQTWIVVADDPAVSGLVTTARGLGGAVSAVVVGRKSVADSVARAGVDEVLWLGEPGDGAPVEAYAGEVARVLAEAGAAPLAVVGATTPAGRALLGAVAARFQVPVLAGLRGATLEGDAVVVERSVLGGIAERRVQVVGGPSVLAVPAGGVTDEGTAAAVREVPAQPFGAARVTDVRVKEQTGVDLGAARAVVAVGRGLKAQADLDLITDLAAAAGAELACSRPLAEGVDWVAKERYIGISGQHIAPELYVAVGISGQLQHMVGVRDAKVVVAINSDKAAPVFAQCDYGIVGDLYEVVPALAAALRAGS